MTIPTIHISKMSGKMSGIPSISTCSLANKNCQANRKIKGSICSKCFSASTQNCYKQLPVALKRNDKLLSDDIIPWDYLPMLNSTIVRLESFGDIINTKHLLNYCRLAEKNKQATFALWTKRHNLCDQFFNRYPKPENLILIYSSLMINQPVTEGKHSDKVFTVYDKGYIKDNHVSINCGSRECLSCQLCYTKNDTIHIKEQLK